MKLYELSNKSVPANGKTVGVVQATVDDGLTYNLKNTSPPANYTSGPAAPVVTAIVLLLRRRQMFLVN